MVDMVEKVVKDPRVKPDTHAIALTALLKLSSRFPVCTGLVLYSFSIFISNYGFIYTSESDSCFPLLLQTHQRFNITK